MSPSRVVNVRSYECADGTVLGRGEVLPPNEVERARAFGVTDVVRAFPPADEVAELSGEALDVACEAAGVDVTSGGSLADGSLSAAEKRDALS